MNTTELETIFNTKLFKNKFPIRNVFSLDQFIASRSILKRNINSISICNDQPMRMAGNHWFLVLKRHNQLYFLDSLSRELSYYGVEKKLSEMGNHFQWHTNPLQSSLSSVRGEYCLMFCYFLCSDKNEIHDILHHFSTDREQNDMKVKYFMTKTFPNYNRNNEAEDTFWSNQIKNDSNSMKP